MLLLRASSAWLGSVALVVVACASGGNDESSGGAGSTGKGGKKGAAGDAGAGAGKGGGSGAGSGGGGSGCGGTAIGSGGAGATGGGAAGGSGGSVGGTAGKGGGSGAGGRAGGGGGAGAGKGGGAGTSGGASGRGGSAGSATGGDAGGGGTPGEPTGGSTYDETVLGDGPVAYWAMSGSSSETDLTGNGHDGTYKGGTPGGATLPNGDDAADFDGAKQYLTVPSSAVFSIPTTQELTWEGWMRPDVLQFSNDTNGYVDWLGKCEEYAPTCEWEGRMYSMTNSENRCNRLSAYAFNPDGNLGSGAFWQQTDCGGSIVAGSWYHIVGEYSLKSSPSGCSNTDQYPGSVNIWVNGVPWSQSSHGDTGCMSQYQVVPQANDSALNIGTMAKDAWFEGAVGKVAIYDELLSDAAIKHHYQVMTGKASTGSCGNTCSF